MDAVRCPDTGSPLPHLNFSPSSSCIDKGMSSHKMQHSTWMPWRLSPSQARLMVVEGQQPGWSIIAQVQLSDNKAPLLCLLVLPAESPWMNWPDAPGQPWVMAGLCSTGLCNEQLKLKSGEGGATGTMFNKRSIHAAYTSLTIPSSGSRSSSRGLCQVHNRLLSRLVGEKTSV